MQTYNLDNIKSKYDRCEVIKHLNNFDSPLKTSILLKLPEWIKESFGRPITLYSNSELLSYIPHQLIEITYDYDCRKIPDLYIKSESIKREIISTYNNKEILQPCEIILEGILNIKMNYEDSLNTIFETMYNLYNDKNSELLKTDKSIINKMTDILLQTILPYLLEGYMIFNKIFLDIRPADDYEYLITYSYINTIIEELVDGINLGKIRRVKYLLYFLYDKILNLDTIKYALPFFILLESKKYNIYNIIKDIKEMQTNNIDIFKIIDSLDISAQCVDSLSHGFKISNIHNNYNMTKISEEKNKSLLFGDNIIDELDLNKFISKTKDLASEIMHTYKSMNKECSFVLSESQLACIRYEFSDSKRCLIKDEDNSFTILQISGINYLLFRIVTDNSFWIYGMSFTINKDENGEYRNLIKIEYDNDIIYKLKIGDSSNDK